MDSSKYCKDCLPLVRMIPEDHDDLTGQVTDEDMALDEILEIEELDLEEGRFVYYYFDNNVVAREFIQKNLVTASPALCMCKECINKSLLSEEPHYGDGAYATVNSFLSPVSTRASSVRRAHGIRFEERHFRAKIRINKPNTFRKFQKTGGVLRSILPQDVPVVRGKFYPFFRRDAIVISIEEWDGNRWMPSWR